MKQIFINLPVSDVERSMQFYSELGFENNPVFTDRDQKCMVWSEQIFVMLQSKEAFRASAQKPYSDFKNTTAATFTLPVESLKEVNEIISRGLKAGGRELHPMLDEGFMQVRTIEDPDGHVWAAICLDMDKFRKMRRIE